VSVPFCTEFASYQTQSLISFPPHLTALIETLIHGRESTVILPLQRKTMHAKSRRVSTLRRSHSTSESALPKLSHHFSPSLGPQPIPITLPVDYNAHAHHTLLAVFRAFHLDASAFRISLTYTLVAIGYLSTTVVSSTPFCVCSPTLDFVFRYFFITYLILIIPGCSYPPPHPLPPHNCSSLYIPHRTHWIIEAPSTLVSTTEWSSRLRQVKFALPSVGLHLVRICSCAAGRFPFLSSQRETPKMGRSFWLPKILCASLPVHRLLVAKVGLGIKPIAAL